ncbi:hypothetical protein COS31_02165 [Candidatus Roizmanbacteria bacterium CG02_land_8_20_14_3_00_36_15]|uniref:50S ribosomal protein L17 n=2 Tax=Candidatus Roizmaniibacteriota TaxID=1752723 RepID=A0A2M8KLU9_9BACT|nr:MAG: hypothetical protein COS51_03190 [Candidatus Roizmanbacteria bacterium CG03_land_8_20_14_0_80_36_21]PIV37870.1 MAG: hypothetical protein COS31_02165 [Candidatus Roizmanbacteria bacterium CG02_land_8_20_14_3_00_36_15]PIY70171.1 MAG: hypothetical protein COY89_02405 [Candidatus Roizmanbacteria bacterium CG_4_10_14_0_8_um_filter_36_36]PJA53649.1 MAG: hypothetical protein CO166_01160 [Candidatus Roizmanbacteria bacterium CG_4_9_14_3_um_filter_36_11]PJC81678.1 MAG: hypothetical protein CO007
MRHRVKKIKFNYGRDANRMLLRKLSVNFLTKGKLTTTKAKIKSLKSFLEIVLNKAKEETEANKNFIWKRIGDKKIIRLLFKEIGPAIKKKTSGYLKLNNLGKRLSDGSEMVKIEWSIPVVLENKKKPLVLPGRKISKK